MKVSFSTLGCKANQADTQAMMAMFREAGHTALQDAQDADAFIINTCTVTMVSDKKSRQLIAQIHQRNPEALIAAVGCYAQRAAEEVLRLEGVTLVAGAQERASLLALVEQAWEKQRTTLDTAPAQAQKHNAVAKAPSQAFEELPAACEGRTRASLKIQDGCDQFCTYCIIPHVRGRARSRSLQSVKAQAQMLAEQGFAELVLTGIHLASYGRDEGVTLLDAIEAASAVQRIRLGSLEPGLVTEAFARGVAGMPQVCRQFHVSLQSGCDTVLARMGRRYTSAQYAQSVYALREVMPNAAITTDIIAGFPQETEEEHQETLRFAEQMGFARLHVFPYSLRSGTKAAQMSGQLTRAIKHRRAKQLIELGNSLSEQYCLSQTGSVSNVLFETWENGFNYGYTDTYIACKVEGPPECRARVEKVRLLEMQGELMLGERVIDKGK